MCSNVLRRIQNIFSMPRNANNELKFLQYSLWNGNKFNVLP